MPLPFLLYVGSRPAERPAESLFLCTTRRLPAHPAWPGRPARELAVPVRGWEIQKN